ncbi:MAG: glycosyltransferase [Candidatus Sumerlaeaceae bacterium]|nr:glycosyltransferase [Candidatus Sumerlaeaceae bacterium]
MDRLLLICHDFPPALSGVRRVLKFAKYLPEFGWEPIVLTAYPDDRLPMDTNALHEVIRLGIPVYRTPSLDPYRAARAFAMARNGLGSVVPSRRRGTAPLGDGASESLLKRVQEHCAQSRPPSFARRAALGAGRAVTRLLLLPDDRVGWVPFAATAAERLLRSLPVRCIVSSSYPHSAHLAGLWLRRRYRVAWIADFRDGWIQNPYFGRGPTPLHAAWNRWLERRVVCAADAVTTVSEPIARHLASLDKPAKVHVIPNGYDPDDFAGLEPLSFDRFTLAYTGTLFMQRSPERFFAAVRALLDEYPGLADHFQVIFMSKFQPEHIAAIREFKLGSIVHNWGMGTYREALRLQMSADALLVLEGEAEHAEIMLTQKIFEYLAAGRPILAVTPPGALADTVRRSGAGVVAAPDDIFAIKERLYDLFNGRARFQPDSEYIAQFHRRALAGQMAKVASLAAQATLTG